MFLTPDRYLSSCSRVDFLWIDLSYMERRAIAASCAEFTNENTENFILYWLKSTRIPVCGWWQVAFICFDTLLGKVLLKIEFYRDIHATVCNTVEGSSLTPRPNFIPICWAIGKFITNQLKKSLENSDFFTEKICVVHFQLMILLSNFHFLWMSYLCTIAEGFKVLKKELI